MTDKELIKLLQELSGGMTCGKHVIELGQAAGRIEAITALCDMIAKHEKPPVDRKLLCAQEAWRLHDEDLDSVTISVRAIELWEEGFGK